MAPGLFLTKPITSASLAFSGGAFSPSRNAFLVHDALYCADDIRSTRAWNSSCAPALSTGMSFSDPANCTSPRNTSFTSSALMTATLLAITNRSAARAGRATSTTAQASRRRRAGERRRSMRTWIRNLEADRVLQSPFVQRTAEAVVVGAVELELHGSARIRVVAHPDHLPRIGPAVGQRGEVQVGLVQRRPFHTQVRQPMVAQAVPHMQVAEPARVR